MHYRAIILVSIFTLSALGCDKPIALQEEEMLIGSYYKRDKDKVKEIQLILMYAGFDPKYVDGFVGPSTREAIRKFQKSINLPSSGYISKETWAEIKKIKEEGGLLDVKDIQFALRNADFDPGAIDGNLGAKTQNAIERFQAEKGLEVTRIINPETWSELKRYSPKSH